MAAFRWLTWKLGWLVYPSGQYDAMPLVRRWRWKASRFLMWGPSWLRTQTLPSNQ